MMGVTGYILLWGATILVSCRPIPSPVLSSLCPDHQFSSASSFTLTVRGSSFQDNSQVFFNNRPISTTFVSAGELNCTISPADMAVTPGCSQIAVVSVCVGTPQAAKSNRLGFSVYIYPEFMTARKLSDSTTSSSDSIRPLIEIDNAQRLYAAWRDRGKVLFSSSGDGGATWSPSRAVHGHSASSYRFSMAVDKSTGAVFVAWEEGSVIFIIKSADCGRTWTSPAALTNATETSAENPGIFVDRSGNIFVVCLSRSPQSGPPYFVVILKSSDHGSSFKEISRIAWSTYFTGEGSPQFGADKTGVLYLVFPSDLNTRYSTNYLTFSTNGGLRWSTPSRISLVAPSMTVDDQNAVNLIGANMYLPYMYKLTFKRSVDRGASWTSRDWQDSRYAISDIVVNAFGSTDLVWANRFSRSYDHGLTWNQVVSYTEQTEADRPSFVEDPSGRIYIIWWNTGGGIYFTASKK